ncbi:hypothetical protein B0H19DRAFT_1175794 [Mycena capillaripes]|nr:hypothetical protein B0H19DRAFT_1175794 [Mycena capillaripes]
MAAATNPYIIHPLDLSDVVFGTDDAENNFTACVSTIFPLAASSEDALFGDTFMRNAYSIFNFGDTVAKTPTHDATMQLLSQTPDARTWIQEVLSGFIPGYVPAPPASVLPATPVPGTSASGSLTVDASDSSANGSSDSTVKQHALIVIGLLSGKSVGAADPSGCGCGAVRQAERPCAGPKRQVCASDIQGGGDARAGGVRGG